MQSRLSSLWMPLALVLLAGWVQPAEQLAIPSPANHSPAAAKQAVEQLFSSYAEHDCAALETLLGGKLHQRLAQKGCAQMLENEPLRQAQIVHIGQPKQDGRDASAWMVNVVVRIDARRWPMIVRVQHNGERHQIVAM